VDFFLLGEGINRGGMMDAKDFAARVTQTMHPTDIETVLTILDERPYEIYKALADNYRELHPERAKKFFVEIKPDGGS
jgi:hypothetical protein